jgi:hypothetical protein
MHPEIHAVKKELPNSDVFLNGIPVGHEWSGDGDVVVNTRLVSEGQKY